MSHDAKEHCRKSVSMNWWCGRNDNWAECWCLVFRKLKEMDQVPFDALADVWENRKVQSHDEPRVKSLVCAEHGKLAPGALDHPSCSVVIYTGGVSKVCPCDCTVCKRAWWADRRPRVGENGQIEREPS